MGLDSIELVLAWEEAFGISISDEEACRMFTPRQAIEYIYQKVKSDLPEDDGCLSMRAFFRLRKEFQKEGIPRREIKPDTKISALLPSRKRRDVFGAILERAGLRPLKQLPFGLQFTFGRIKDAVADAVIRQHASLRLPGHGWSKAQVREVVRAITCVQQGIGKFSDDAGFVKDLGID
jgi:hypothetical protein